MFNPPRLMLAGSGGDSGKTLAALGLCAYWRREGLTVVPFKKGPDYIDAAWLTLAAGRPTRNLDTWMMGADAVVRSFTTNSVADGMNLIEANRGLHDGENARGSHSSAVLAKLLDCQVVLVLPVRKVTRTAAAVALGMRSLEPDVHLAGVILNRVAGERHLEVTRRAVEDYSGLPVLGALPNVRRNILPDRHLGLVTPQEHHRAGEAIREAAALVSANVDCARLLEISRNAAPLPEPPATGTDGAALAQGNGLRVGYFNGSGFTFYYPENLEALQSAGVTLVGIDPAAAQTLPDLDALYIGGGFPETHAAQLAGNRSLQTSIRRATAAGLPVWAECGGLMFLARSLRIQGETYPMCGVLPVDVEMHERPQGHGYEEVEVDTDNPFLPVGTILRGHEFHYSAVVAGTELQTAFKVRRGSGVGENRDGIITGNVMASYLHIHHIGCLEWSMGIVEAARKYREYLK